jgi:3'-5' exoribonuclease
VAADCLVSIRWQGNAVSIGGHVRIGRLVALERPMAGLNLFDTVPTRWVRERELVQRGKALWESLPLAFRDLFNAMFWNGGRFRRYLVGPSSLENHHNGLNGNFRHSLEVAEQALALARDHELVSLPVMILAGLIHDAGKADEYRYDHAHRCFAMAPEATLVGHRDRLQHWLAAARERCGEGVPQRQYLALVHALTATSGAPPHLGLREPLSLEAMLLSMADRASGRTELIGRLASPGGGFGRYHRHLRGRPFVAAAWDA